MAKEGMEVGNHTWNHPDLTKVSSEEIKTEISRTDELLTKLTGHTTKPLFRFPYGARDANSVAVVNELGYRSIYWTLDSQDSVGQPKSVDYLVNRITGKTNAELDGAIILMHIGTRTSGEALPIIIEKLQARGFKIVPVSEIIR
jgi:peptidoglycan/xylan/chitin deacetylase (PgdA/CDA1 family)